MNGCKECTLSTFNLERSVHVPNASFWDPNMTLITVISDLCVKLDSIGDRDKSHWGSFASRRQEETRELVSGEQSAGASNDDGKSVGTFV